MTLTWSVANGGALCTCGHLKCEHRLGIGICTGEDCHPKPCGEFKDRAEPKVNPTPSAQVYRK